MEKRKNEIVFWLIWGTMICIIVAIVGFATWPLKPVDLTAVELIDSIDDGKDIPVINPTIIAGNPVHFMVRGMKHTDRPSKVIYQLVNTRVTTYSVIEGNLGKGTDHYPKALPTSKYDMSGIYYVRTTICVNYWGIRDVCVMKDSNTFTMVCPAKAERGIQGIQGKKGDKGEKGKTGGVEFNINRSGK
jgi:hypothetical protein